MIRNFGKYSETFAKPILNETLQVMFRIGTSLICSNCELCYIYINYAGLGYARLDILSLREVANERVVLVSAQMLNVAKVEIPKDVEFCGISRDVEFAPN